MYYKHEDELKSKIAHCISGTTTTTTTTTTTSDGNIPRKPKRLTPTQIRKLEKMKLEQEDDGEKKDA